MARKRRTLDNIEKDVIAAMQLGYGVHYGRYKADHPNTREDAPESEIPPEHIKTCRNCGAPFSTHGRHYRKLYCNDDCRRDYCSRQAYKRRLNAKEVDTGAL